MQITARIDYGIRAMLGLAAAAPATVKGTGLAHSQGLPVPYLHNILAELRRAKLVHSVRGVAGGYTLTRPADTITLADIVTALDGAFLGVPVIRTKYRGPAAALYDVWVAADAAVLTVLGGTTLADLLQAGPGEPVPGTPPG